MMKRVFGKAKGFTRKGDTPTDAQLVHKASSWLGVGEFAIFADAWQAWYHEKPSEKRLEPFFVSFLEQGTVPFWVRNYVRLILNRQELIIRERKRLIIGALTYYGPLLVFFLILMWFFYN